MVLLTRLQHLLEHVLRLLLVGAQSQLLLEAAHEHSACRLLLLLLLEVDVAEVNHLRNDVTHFVHALIVGTGPKGQGAILELLLIDAVEEDVVGRQTHHFLPFLLGLRIALCLDQVHQLIVRELLDIELVSEVEFLANQHLTVQIAQALRIGVVGIAFNDCCLLSQGAVQLDFKIFLDFLAALFPKYRQRNMVHNVQDENDEHPVFNLAETKFDVIQVVARLDDAILDDAHLRFVVEELSVAQSPVAE